MNSAEGLAVLHAPHSSMSAVALLESTTCLSIEKRIAQSSYLFTYWDNESTPNPIDIERKVTEQLCSSAGL